MSSIVNRGSQVLLYSYKQDVTSEGFNQLNHKLHPHGIYQGGDLIKMDNNLVRIEPFFCVYELVENKVSVRIETNTFIEQFISETAPFIIGRFEWKNIEYNFLDIKNVEDIDITDTDLILGKGIYENGILIGFDYSRKTWSYNYYNRITNYTPPFKVIPTEPYSTKVQVLPGGPYIFNGNIIQLNNIVESPDFEFPIPSEGRIDVICLDKNSNIVIIKGNSATTLPLIPTDNFPIAIVSFPPNITNSIIRGDYIQYVHPNTYLSSEIYTTTDSTPNTYVKRDSLGNITANKFISTTTSEPPLVVNSNIKVSNLNAEFFNDLSSTDVVRTTGNVSQTITGNKSFTGIIELQNSYLNTNQPIFNLLNTVAEAINFAGNANVLNIGSNSGTVNFNGTTFNFNNSLDFIIGTDDTTSRNISFLGNGVFNVGSILNKKDSNFYGTVNIHNDIIVFEKSYFNSDTYLDSAPIIEHGILSVDADKKIVTLKQYSTDNTLSNESDDLIPTERAIKLYVDSHIGVLDTNKYTPIQYNTGIIIPMYVYPSDIYNNTIYNNLISFAREHKDIPIIAILNPSNGPGGVIDNNYRVAIKRLYSANIYPVGYVYTNYANRPIADVKADIDAWKTIYPEIKGIFFDEMTYEDNPTYVNYYKELSDYIYSKNIKFSIGNSKVPCAGSYYNTFDIIINWENSMYPTEAQAKEDWAGGSSEYSILKRGLLVHSQSSFDSITFTMIAKYYGWVYITNDTLPNPWDTVSIYLKDMSNYLGGSGGEAFNEINNFNTYGTQGNFKFKYLGSNTANKMSAVLFTKKYDVNIDRQGFQGTVFLNRGSTGYNNLSFKWDVTCVNSLNNTIFSVSGDNIHALTIEITYNGEVWYGLMFTGFDEFNVTAYGLFWGEDPIFIPDISPYSYTMKYGSQFVTDTFVSRAVGTPPLEVYSNTKVNNLNADMVDGFHADTTANANTIIVRDASGRAKVAAPSAADDIARKDTVDAHANATTGIHGATSAATANTIAMRDGSGGITASYLNGTAYKIRTSAPASPADGDIWIA